MSRARKKRQPEVLTVDEVNGNITKIKSLTALNQHQKEYFSKVKSNIITFCTGPAGTGKTVIPINIALLALINGDVKKIIITRPVVEAAEEKIGFLPGEMNEKFSPYITPVLDALHSMAGPSYVENAVKLNKIVFIPMAFIRGMTFKDAFVLADEMQNAKKSQMKLLLSRVGENTKIVLNGDLEQKDIQANGMEDAISRLQSVSGVAIHRFGHEDIVRSGIAKDIILAYSDYKPISIEQKQDNSFCGFDHRPEFISRE